MFTVKMGSNRLRYLLLRENDSRACGWNKKPFFYFHVCVCACVYKVLLSRYMSHCD